MYASPENIEEYATLAVSRAAALSVINIFLKHALNAMKSWLAKVGCEFYRYNTLCFVKRKGDGRKAFLFLNFRFWKALFETFWCKNYAEDFFWRSFGKIKFALRIKCLKFRGNATFKFLLFYANGGFIAARYLHCRAREKHCKALLAGYAGGRNAVLVALQSLKYIWAQGFVLLIIFF